MDLPLEKVNEITSAYLTQAHLEFPVPSYFSSVQSILSIDSVMVQFTLHVVTQLWSNPRWRTNVKFGNFRYCSSQEIYDTMATAADHTRRKKGIKLIQRGKGKSLTSHMQQQEDSERS